MSASPSERRIAAWLLLICAMVFAMVVLGGVTRLTHSGLSIVEWQPLVGTIPPLSEHDWQELYEKYKASPEFLQVNVDMDIEGFREIFWLEYFHRLLGRIIGFAFLVPFLVFLYRREIPKALAPKLALMFVLGGLQGLMGWLMVASGLIDEPRVSPYRLTAHLALAVLIYGYMLWVALGLLSPSPRAGIPSGLRGHGIGVTSLIVLTMLAGGFVAGTRAGLTFNDWPLMHGQLVPAGLYEMSPWWADVFENVATVQFHHRIMAYLVFVVVVAWWSVSRRAALDPVTRRWFLALMAVMVLQVVLGVSTLMMRVPVVLGSAHQAGALVLLTVALLLNHRLRR